MNTQKIFLTVIVLFSALAVFAQPAPPATPIDGGLSLLLAGGAAFGIKKIYDKRKEQ